MHCSACWYQPVPLIAATYQATPDSCQCTEAACRVCERHKGHAAVVDHNLETLMRSNLQQQQQQQFTPGVGSVVLEQERLGKQGREKGCDGRGNKSATQPQQHAKEAMRLTATLVRVDSRSRAKPPMSGFVPAYATVIG